MVRRRSRVYHRVTERRGTFAGRALYPESRRWSPLPHQPRRGLEAFASRDFRRYQLARVAAILGAEAQSVAVAWQVYSITHRAIDLGYTGLALFSAGTYSFCCRRATWPTASTGGA